MRVSRKKVLDKDTKRCYLHHHHVTVIIYHLTEEIVTKRQKLYTADHVRAILEIMRAAPPVEKREDGLRKADVIKALKSDIRLLQRKGYSLAQIAEMIRKGGVDISTPTLKSYMQRGKDAGGKKAAAVVSKAAAEATAAAAATAVSARFEVRPDTDDL